jgi:elongation factor G
MEKHPFQLIDTGYAAFGGSINCMRAFGGAVFVLNPSVGLRVESERLWDKANDNRISRLFFASKMDHEQDNAAERIDSMLEGLEVKGIHLQMPIGVEANFKGVVDLLSMAYLYEGDSENLPKGFGDLRRHGGVRQKLMESGRKQMTKTEKYLDGKELRRRAEESHSQQTRQKALSRALLSALNRSAFRNCWMLSLIVAVPIGRRRNRRHEPDNRRG